VISDGPRFQLEKSLEGCSGVNLFAEGGYYYSQPNFGTWVPIFSHDVLNNQSILKVMKQYQQKTDGVKLRVTDTQIKWRYHHLVSDLARGIVSHHAMIFRPPICRSTSWR
jgi:trehalose-6-phosphatase